MKQISALVIAVTIALTAGAAHARGDGGQESQRKLQAAIAEQRAAADAACANASLWEMMFGHEEAVAEQEAPASGS